MGLAIAERIASLRRIPSRCALCRDAAPCSRSKSLAEAQQQLPAASAEPIPVATRSRVLVVDNDADVLRGMRSLLETWRCHVATACSTDEAMIAFEAHQPELLLLDYHLGGGATGIALRAALGDEAMRLPCVVITADHDPAIRAEVEAAGCHLLYKPLRPLALRSVMARIVASTAPLDG